MIATSRRPLSQDHGLRGYSSIDLQILDVTSPDSCQECFEYIRRAYGYLSCVINNAGLSRFGPVAEQSIEEEFMTVFSTNVFGAVRVVQYAVPLMLQKGGLILNIGSVTSFLTTPWSAAYSSSKAALLNVTSAMRQELAPFGIDATFAMAGAIKSNFGNNSAMSDFSRYDTVTSLYQPYANAISQRAFLSQGKDAVPAEAVSEDVWRVIQRRFEKGKKPSLWFYTGGKSRLLYILGVIQKCLDILVDKLLMRQNTLNTPRHGIPSTKKA